MRPFAEAGRKRWLPLASALLSGFQLLAGGARALWGFASRADTYSHAADRWWGTVAVGAGILLSLSSLSAMFFLLFRKAPPELPPWRSPH